MARSSARDRLSKSSFLRGLQCEKSLYLSRYRPELRDEIDSAQEQIFNQGSSVGMLARGLFAGGVAADTEGEDQVRRTNELIKAGHEVIYEAAFSYSGVYSAVDILVKGAAGWKVFEVKSSTGVHDIHLTDTALQLFVLTGCGLEIADFYLIHVNSHYVLGDSLDIQRFFTRSSVLAECQERQPEIRKNVNRLRSVLRLSEAPEVDIGEYCSTPYGCDFVGHCWKHVPEVSIFDLPRIRKRRLFDLYRSGVLRIDDIPVDWPLGRVSNIVEVHRTGTTHIDRSRIREFIASLIQPISFMDFETVFPAVPMFRGTRPYQQIPFQFCLGSSKANGIRWTDFLASGSGDPRRAFADELLRNVEGEGSIVVYNKQFEIGRLRELARDFPEYQLSIERIIVRIIDLLDVFRGGMFYDMRMQGSNSLKAVLPVFAPDLDYGKLEIGDGGTASRAFESLRLETDPSTTEFIRSALIRYCRNDTEGMVRILEGLQDIVGQI